MEGRGRLTGVSWSRPPLLEEGIAIFILQVGKHLREVSGLLRFTQPVGRTHTEVPRGGEGCAGGWTTVWRMFLEDDLQRKRMQAFCFPEAVQSSQPLAGTHSVTLPPLSRCDSASDHGLRLPLWSHRCGHLLMTVSSASLLSLPHSLSPSCRMAQDCPLSPCGQSFT